MPKGNQPETQSSSESRDFDMKENSSFDDWNKKEERIVLFSVLTLFNMPYWWVE